MMRGTETRGWSVHNSRQAMTSPRARMRAVRLAAVALGIGMVMSVSVARAQDSEDDDSTFEEKIIKNIMEGIGGTNMDNRGIDYRERSPLVIPPKIDLPPPVSASNEVTAPNWPKDVDEAERERIRAINKKNKVTGNQGARPLMPSELAVGKTKHVAVTEPLAPGANQNPMLSPSQLGYKGSLLSTMFGGNKAESAPFTGEPDREVLTQPPVGYQTPSPSYAYGTGPRESLNKDYDIMKGKEVK